MARWHGLSGPRGSARATALTLALGLGFVGLYTKLLISVGASYAALGILFVSLMIGTFLWLEVGFVTLILAMLFSPEVNLGMFSLQQVTLRVEDLIIPAILAAWLAQAAWRGRSEMLRLHPVMLPFLCWLAIAVISTVNGAGAGRIELGRGLLYVLKQAEFFGIFMFTLQYLQSLKQVRLMVVLALVTSVLLALYNFGRVGSTKIWTEDRITAPFEGAKPEPSSIGGYFAFSLAIFIAMLIYAPRRRRGWLIAGIAIIVPPFLLTLSRTSYVAFLALLVVMALRTRNKKLTAILVGGLLASPFLLPTRVIDRVMYTFNDRIKMLGYFDRSFGERVYIWYKAYWNFKSHPIIGGGVTFHDIIDSSYARLIVETGLLGTLCFLTVLVILLRQGARLERSAKLWWIKGLALGYTVGLVGLMVHALTAVTFNIVRIMEPFWLMTGGIVAASALLERQADDPDGSEEDLGLAVEATG